MARVTPRLLKGFRDYLPRMELARAELLAIVTEVFQSFGFGPLMTPAIEYSDILLGKYGEEGEKLLYRFEDNGGRDVALRYDLTVPLARVVAQYGDLPQPFRRYQIAPVWRAEKPGKGRFREFMQCDVDIVGEPSVRADAECMAVGLAVLAALGVPAYEMRVNNRKILDGLLDVVGVTETEHRHAVMRAIDKLPKIGRERVAEEIRANTPVEEAGIDTLFAFLERPVRTRADLPAAREIVGATESGAAGIAELDELLAILETAGVAEHVVVDLSIARGLDYYTATIYETFLVGHESYGSVMSGGRYDTLIGVFSKNPVPAVGISLGVDRLVAALSDLDVLKARETPADAFIALLAAEDYAENLALASVLRGAGVKTELALTTAKLGKQFKRAERKGFGWVILAGSAERAAGTFVVKDLSTGEQTIVARSDLAGWASSLAS